VPGTNVESIDVASNKITINTYDENIGELAVSDLATGFGITLGYSGGARGTGAEDAFFDPIVRLADGPHHFENGEVDLPVYTKGEINTLIANEFKSFNAMHYKGAISSAKEIPTTNVRIGDTYKIAKAFGSYERNGIIIA
jgi:hypothetical protein